MFGVERYIDQNYKDHDFSEPLYAQSVIAGGNSIVSKDYGFSGAKCILINSIIISVSADVCFADVCILTSTFTDVNGRVLFMMDQTASINGIYNFWKVLSGSQLFISCNNANMTFSISHQYLTVKEDR